MKKRNRKRGREGFTLIEVIASTALLMVTATGFLMMTGANTGLLAKEHRLDQSNYRLSAMAEEGLGEATGAELVVEISMEGTPAIRMQGLRKYFISTVSGRTKAGMRNLGTVRALGIQL